MNACAELFISLLESKNFHYSSHIDDDGDVIVDFPFKGKVFKCFFNGSTGSYLSLYCLYEHIPDEKLVDVIFLCNELNTKYKWITFYVDHDKDLLHEHRGTLERLTDLLAEKKSLDQGQLQEFFATENL